MSLSQELLDAIDGAKETTGRDTQLTEWAEAARKLESALVFLEPLCRPLPNPHDDSMYSINGNELRALKLDANRYRALLVISEFCLRCNAVHEGSMHHEHPNDPRDDPEWMAAALRELSVRPS